ncbi:MAG: hypothetical protein ACKO5K_15200 [Armatimonadota bacterium]
MGDARLAVVDAKVEDPEWDRTARDVVDWVNRRGLTVPAILALEMHRPVGSIVGNGIVAATPLLAPLLGAGRLESIANLVSAPGGIEELIRRIEDAAAANAPLGAHPDGNQP